MTDLAIMCLHTLQQMDVSDTGLYLAALSPFLKMGATRMVVHWSGILPVSTNVVNMEVSSFGEILSGLLAFFVLSPFGSLVMPV